MIFKNHGAAPHFIVTMRIKRSYIGRFPTKTGQLKHFETVEGAISRPCTHSATDCFLFHARLLTRIFPYGRILAGQVGAFALFPLTIQICRKREDKYALYNNFGW